MSDLEAVGEAATGAVLARAIEPEQGEGEGHTHEAGCLNCGAALAGDYCHDCGQKAHVHRTLGAFWHDLAHSVLHFEGKIWRTLPMLALQPGQLTRRYIHGERARFVSPMALFLFTVFLMFALFSLIGPNVNAGKFRNSSAYIRAALEEERSDLVELQQERAEAVREDPAAVAKVDEQIAKAREGIAELERVNLGAEGTNEMVGGNTGWRPFDEGLKKLNENQELAVYKLQTNGYKFSWALIPISVPFVWLLFLHRRRYRQFGAYDHTVFVTYSITFMSLALIAVALLAQVPRTAWLRNAMIVIPPLHMLLQLRGAYGLGWFSAAWRTLVLSSFAFLALVLFLFLLLALGVFG